MPASGELVLGLNAFTATNTGTTAVPVWAVILNTKDETLNMETTLSDVTTRAAAGWRLQVGTLSEATVTTQVLYKSADPTVDLIRNAFLNKSRVLMGFFDADPSTAEAGPPEITVSGLMGGFGVTNFSINKSLEEAMMIDVTYTVREDDNGNGPQWVTLNTDPPVYPA